MPILFVLATISFSDAYRSGVESANPHDVKNYAQLLAGISVLGFLFAGRSADLWVLPEIVRPQTGRGSGPVGPSGSRIGSQQPKLKRIIVRIIFAF
jgi:hypothetical protein